MQLGRYMALRYLTDGPGDPAVAGVNSPKGGRKARRAFKGKPMRISDFCFLFAGASALTGMAMGFVMGMSQDFTLAPSHAHLNLLGWVTMAIYGLYHRGAGRTGGLTGWLQAASGAFGAAAMSGGLAHYLVTGSEALMPLALTGIFMAVVSMVLFVGLVLADTLRRRSSAFRAEAQSG
jgi:hypothetical protein